MKKIIFSILVLLSVNLPVGKVSASEYQESIFQQKYKTDFNKNTIGFNFDNQMYYLRSSSYENEEAVLEFLKKEDTFDNYSEVMTVQTIKPGFIDVNQYLEIYLENVRNLQVTDSLVYDNGKKDTDKEIIIDSLLADEKSNILEHVLNRIKLSSDKKQIVVYIHSKRINLKEAIKNNDLVKTEFGKNKERWIKELKLLDFKVF